MKTFLIIILVVFSTVIFAQEKISFATPPPSPEASITQQLVKGKITVTYSRPLARGRKVFGGLVQFDSLWRTGAGNATTIHLTEDIILGDNTLYAGKYSMFTIPAEKEWTIIINADTNLHGIDDYDVTKDIHRFKVKAAKNSTFSEAFTIDLNEITNKGEGFLNLSWENTLVKIPIKSLLNEKIMAEIKSRLVDSNEQNAKLFFEAANYYYTTGRDLKQAAAWATAAEQLDKENFYYPYLLQKILADLKDYKAAIHAANRAIAIGEKEKKTSFVNALKKRVAEWEMK